MNPGDPAAWKFNYDRITKILRENSVDWLRIDFNMTAQINWLSHDEPDRRSSRIITCRKKETVPAQ